MNKIIFMGRLCGDPEVRFTTGGNAMCIATFNLAVDRRFKKKDDEDAPSADFFRITTFGKLGEFTEKYLNKGTKVVVEGRVENNNYTDKSGNKVYGFQFIAENIEFAESKKAAESNSSTKTTNQDFMNVVPGNDLTLPFD